MNENLGFKISYEEIKKHAVKDDRETTPKGNLTENKMYKVRIIKDFIDGTLKGIKIKETIIFNTLESKLNWIESMNNKTVKAFGGSDTYKVIIIEQ